jgi:diacylglycerol kinase (ATP)
VRNKPVFSADQEQVAPARASRSDVGDVGWVGIVANRNSGSGQGLRLVRRLVCALRGLSLRSTIAWTPEERASLVSESARDPACRCLVSVGGDGTISALINERPVVPVTVLPAGTENLVAQHFGLRGDPEALANTIATGSSVRVDVGQAGERRFLLMAGFGFDGDMVSRHHQTRVSSSGRIRPTHRIAYVEPVLRASFSYPFPPISVKIDDDGVEEVLSGTTVLVFNLPRYALGLLFAPEARDDDGWLDLIVFREPGPFQALYYLWKVLLGSHLDDPGVLHRRVKKLVVTADHPIPVQLDGDPGGYVLPQNSASSIRDAPVVAVNGAGPARKRDEGLAGQSLTHWTLEILPAALSVFAAADRPPQPARVPLAEARARR